jgi:hypothetical protein
MSVEVQFKMPEQVVLMRPGQTTLITVGGTTVEVRCIDHDPFRSLEKTEPKSDLYVLLRKGEQYTTRREDGTTLTVLVSDQ